MIPDCFIDRAIAKRITDPEELAWLKKKEQVMWAQQVAKECDGSRPAVPKLVEVQPPKEEGRFLFRLYRFIYRHIFRIRILTDA